MKVSGFTFIRNAIKYDIAIVESIKSILPLCDELVVAVGKSEDDTLRLVKEIDPSKIKIIETEWDECLREGGLVMAAEADKAFKEISNEADWCIFMQGDEVIHEKYLPIVRDAMVENIDKLFIDGFLFKYMHFYGSYKYIRDSHRWYRREIRVIRNDRRICSFRDAQGFRIIDSRKLQVKPIDAYVYHYGWVHDPRTMQRKLENIARYSHNDQWIKKHVPRVDEYDFTRVDALNLFEGTHPVVMQERIENSNLNFEYDISKNRFSQKDKLVRFIEKLSGYRPGEFQNYRIV